MHFAGLLPCSFGPLSRSDRGGNDHLPYADQIVVAMRLAMDDAVAHLVVRWAEVDQGWFRIALSRF